MQTWSDGRIAIASWQHIPDRLADLGLTEEDGRRQAWFVDANGRLHGGAAAINAAMSAVRWARPFTFLYRLPGSRQLQDWLYRQVAANRHRLPGGNPTCAL